MWCEDVQESPGYDGELDEGLQPAGHVRVEFGLLLEAFEKRCSVYYTHSGSERKHSVYIAYVTRHHGQL